MDIVNVNMIQRKAFARCHMKWSTHLQIDQIEFSRNIIFFKLGFLFRLHIIYPIYFNMSVNLASFIQCKFFCFTIFVHIIFTLTLLELFWIWIPPFLTIRFDYILTCITTMRFILFGSIAIATYWFVQWFGIIRRGGLRFGIYSRELDLLLLCVR